MDIELKSYPTVQAPKAPNKIASDVNNEKVDVSKILTFFLKRAVKCRIKRSRN